MMTKKIIFAALLSAILPLSFTVGKEPLIHTNVNIDDVQANPKDFKHLKKIENAQARKVKTAPIKSATADPSLS